MPPFFYLVNQMNNFLRIFHVIQIIMITFDEETS